MTKDNKDKNDKKDIKNDCISSPKKNKKDIKNNTFDIETYRKDVAKMFPSTYMNTRLKAFKKLKQAKNTIETENIDMEDETSSSDSDEEYTVKKNTHSKKKIPFQFVFTIDEPIMNMKKKSQDEYSDNECMDDNEYKDDIEDSDYVYEEESDDDSDTMEMEVIQDKNMKHKRKESTDLDTETEEKMNSIISKAKHSNSGEYCKEFETYLDKKRQKHIETMKKKKEKE